MLSLRGHSTTSNGSPIPPWKPAISNTSKTSSRSSSVDIGDRTTGDTSFSTKSDMTTIPISAEIMELEVMEPKVEVDDDCSTTEARPLTFPRYLCVLYAASSFDPRHTPPCTASLVVDDHFSPFETIFEGEIKPSSPPSKDQALLPPLCSISQPQRKSRRSRFASCRILHPLDLNYIIINFISDLHLHEHYHHFHLRWRIQWAASEFLLTSSSQRRSCLRGGIPP